MSFLPGGNLPELLLRDTGRESIETCKDLLHVLHIHHVELRSPDQLLDADEGTADEMFSQSLVDLLEHQLAEPAILALASLENLVDISTALELRCRDPLAHDEGLVALRNAQSLDQRPACAALGHETQRAEGREQEGRGRAVDEVGEGGDGRAQSDDGSVEADDKDLGVCAEGVADVEVEGDEALQPVLMEGAGVRIRRGSCTRDGDIGTAVSIVSYRISLSLPQIAFGGVWLM